MEKKSEHIIFRIPVTVVKDENGTWIIYNKKYNVSGYGKTKKDAREMFDDCIEDILKFKK